MKVLVTGARGMLGQELVLRFGTKHDVTAWDFSDIDITHGDQVANKVSALGPDLVINAAAYNDVDRAETERTKAENLNWYAVGHLARVCAEIGSGMVHFSTDYVFDGKNQAGYAEDAKPSPSSVYGHSKYMGERLLAEVMHGRKFWIIRLSRLFGEPGSSAAAKLSFVHKIREAATTKKVLPVLGEELSCITYAPDLAAATMDIVENHSPGIYHRTNDGAATWFEFAERIALLLDLQVTLEKITSQGMKRAAQRPQYSVLLNTKLPPMRPWQQALAEFLGK